MSTMSTGSIWAEHSFRMGSSAGRAQERVDQLVDMRHSGLRSDNSGDPPPCVVPSAAARIGEIVHLGPGGTSKVGRGSGGALLAPLRDGAADTTDHRLVAKVRRGDDRAFELLYQRYHRRIHAYALGMVKDHGRAEDLTQEVFVSALGRMRATTRPIAFKPWIYEIARNACIDVFRRSKRAEEVSYDH